MPNTVSTPSALRHSMMASTALTYPTSFRDLGIYQMSRRPAGGQSPRGEAGTERHLVVSLAAHEHAFRQRLVGPAAAADLARDRHHVAAFVAFAARLIALEAVEERGEQAEDRKGRPDQEPDEERAALDLPDHAGGQPEEEHQDEPGHAYASRRACSAPTALRRSPRSRPRPRPPRRLRRSRP